MYTQRMTCHVRYSPVVIVAAVGGLHYALCLNHNVVPCVLSHNKAEQMMSI